MYQSAWGLVRELADSTNQGCLLGGVVEHHVEQDADVVVARGGEQAVEVGEGAVLGVDGGVAGDVVAEVDLGRGVHGRDPDGVDAEGLEVGEALSDAVEVADAVVICVLKAARVDLVDDGVVIPGGVGGGGGLGEGWVGEKEGEEEERDEGAVGHGRVQRRKSEATRVRTPGLSWTRATKVWSMGPFSEPSGRCELSSCVGCPLI